MDKEQRHTLAKIYDDPHAAGVRWKDVEQLFLGLGAYAQWSDPSHLTVELKGHKESFETPYRDKKAVHGERRHKGQGFPRVGKDNQGHGSGLNGSGLREHSR